MKLSLLQMIAIVCILTICFMTTTLIVQQSAYAHDLRHICLAASLIAEAYWIMVNHFCYSVNWDPDLCDFWWGMYGAQQAYADEVCNHNPNAVHD